MKILEAARRVLGIEKRAGLYVSRPVLNAAEWYAWAVDAGVPNPVPAAEMHVTVLYSSVNVVVPQDGCPITLMTRGWQGGCFAFFGPKEESLVYAFDSYELWSRNSHFQELGAVSTWPTYRPHFTLSNDAAGFEIPDEDLAEVPEFLVLGGEVYADLKAPAPDDAVTDGSDEEALETDTVIIVLEIAASQEAKALMADTAAWQGLNAVDRTAVRDIAAGRPVTKGVAKRIAKTAWAPGSMKPKPQDPPKPIKKSFVEREVTVSLKSFPRDIAKGMSGYPAEILNEEERIVIGIASVSTVGGVLVDDLQGDQITTQALREFNRSLLTGFRAGKFEHTGEVRTEIVAGLVLSDDLQAVMGFDLGYEPLMTEIHVPRDEDWAEVKKGDWMLSIAGTMYVEVDEGAVS